MIHSMALFILSVLFGRAVRKLVHVEDVSAWEVVQPCIVGIVALLLVGGSP